MSFALLNSFLPRFRIHSHLTPILNRHSSQILSDVTLPSLPRLTNPYCSWSPLCYSFHRIFLSSFTICPIRLILCNFYLSNYISVFDWQIYFLVSSYSPAPILFRIQRSVTIFCLQRPGTPNKVALWINRALATKSQTNNTPFS
jgi:hypothetical protein